MIAETARIYTDSLGDNLEIRDYAIVYKNVELKDSVLVGEHSVVGRVPTTTANVLKKFESGKNTTIDNGVVLCANVVVYDNVRIGANTLIGDNSSIFTDVTIGNDVLISRNVTINSEVIIGNNTRIMDLSHVTGRSVVGSNVFISGGVIMANDNAFGKFGFNDAVQGAIIEDYVSIGSGAIILPGVKIGKGSIVAAGSMVNQDVPCDSFYAGNPGKILRKVPKYLRRY